MASQPYLLGLRSTPKCSLTGHPEAQWTKISLMPGTKFQRHWPAPKEKIHNLCIMIRELTQKKDQMHRVEISFRRTGKMLAWIVRMSLNLTASRLQKGYKMIIKLIIIINRKWTIVKALTIHQQATTTHGAQETHHQEPSPITDPDLLKLSTTKRKSTRDRCIDNHLPTTGPNKPNMRRSTTSSFSLFLNQTVAKFTIQPNLRNSPNRIIKPSSHRDTGLSRSLETHQSSRSHPTTITVSRDPEDLDLLMIPRILDLIKDNRSIRGNKIGNWPSFSIKGNRRCSQEKQRSAHSPLMCKTKMELEVHPRTNSTRMASNSSRRSNTTLRSNKLKRIENSKDKESKPDWWVKTADALSSRRIREPSSRETTTNSSYHKEATRRDSTQRPLPIGPKPVEWEQVQEEVDMDLTIPITPGKMTLFLREECSRHRSTPTAERWVQEPVKLRHSRCSMTRLRFKKDSRNKLNTWLSKELSKILISHFWKMSMRSQMRPLLRCSMRSLTILLDPQQEELTLCSSWRHLSNFSSSTHAFLRNQILWIIRINTRNSKLQWEIKKAIFLLHKEALEVLMIFRETYSRFAAQFWTWKLHRWVNKHLTMRLSTNIWSRLTLIDLLLTQTYSISFKWLRIWPTVKLSH